MKPGKMRYRITIEQSCGNQDEYGNITDEWIDVCTVWADIVPLSGREYLAAEQNMSETQFKIYIRYRDGVTAKMRAREGNHVYELLSVLGDRRSGMLTLMAKEVL